MYINRIVRRQPSRPINTTAARTARTAFRLPAAIPVRTACSNNGDDAGKVTMYDYPAAYAGRRVRQQQERQRRQHRSIPLDGVHADQASSSRWSGQISYFAVKNHRWLSRILPESERRVLPARRNMGVGRQRHGTYRLPYDVSVSGFLQSKSGVKGQRTNIFRTADPDGGPPHRPATATPRFASSRTAARACPPTTF